MIVSEKKFLSITWPIFITNAFTYIAYSHFFVRLLGTFRQFNSLRIKLQGKVLSCKRLLNERIQLLEIKVKKLTKHIKGLKEPFKIHQKKRRLFILENKLKKLQSDQENEAIRLCFGTKKLFHQQFYLEENSFSFHAEWKKSGKRVETVAFL